MTENTVTETVVDTEGEQIEDATTDEATTPVGPQAGPSTESYDKDSWQASLQKAVVLLNRAEKNNLQANSAMWTGARDAIDEWVETSDSDVNASGLRENLLIVMGTARKGTVSKIITIAKAVREAGLETDQFPSLRKAYIEANRLTTKAKEQAAEDDAAEERITEIAENAPKSTSSVEGAATLLLSKGLDGAVVALLDVLNGPSGEFNEAASQALMRSVASEVSARRQAASQAAKDAQAQARAAAKAKADADKAAKATQRADDEATKATKRAAPASSRAKPKTAQPKAESASKGDANKRALPKASTKTAQASAEQAEPATEGADMFDDLGVADEAQPVKAQPAKPAKRAVPRKA